MANYSQQFMESIARALNNTEYDDYYDVYPSVESPIDDELAAISKVFYYILRSSFAAHLLNKEC